MVFNLYYSTIDFMLMKHYIYWQNFNLNPKISVFYMVFNIF